MIAATSPAPAKPPRPDDPAVTPRQRQLLAAILDHARRYGSWPTYRWLMAVFGYASSNSVEAVLVPLRKKGLVEPKGEAALSRSIRLTGCRLIVEYTADPAGDRLRRLLDEPSTKETPTS